MKQYCICICNGNDFGVPCCVVIYSSDCDYIWLIYIQPSRFTWLLVCKRRDPEKWVNGCQTRPNTTQRQMYSYYWVYDGAYCSDAIMSAMASEINGGPIDWLLNRLFRCRSMKTSKLRVTYLCEGNPPVDSLIKASNAKHITIWWRHHESALDCSNQLSKTHVGIPLPMLGLPSIVSTFILFGTKYI